MEAIKDLLKFNPPKPSKTTEWQTLALEMISYFVDGQQKRGSIFKACKINYHKALIAFNDCKELDKPYSMYFFKVFCELCKTN